MEKFSQFRDKGSGIAPFLPIPTEPSGIYLPFHIFLFVCRVPLLLFFAISYFCFLQWLPIGTLIKRLAVWCMLGTPGIWWIDLQIDGVRRGSVSQHTARLPQDGSIIAASCASPIDALYLAAIFDPIFAVCYPGTRQVEPVSLLVAIFRAFFKPRPTPPEGTNLVDLETYCKQNTNRVIVLFPECTTSNGRGILPLSPSLLAAPARTKVFPVNLRYTPPDITSPVPHSYLTFLWNLCGKPTHTIRIRIAEAVYNTSKRKGATTTRATSVDTSDGVSESETLVGSEESEGSTTAEERAFLDKIAEALARLGRVKRVGLGVDDKVDFLAMWTKSKKR